MARQTYARPGLLNPLRRAVFVCPVCGAASWHPEDLRHGYCGRCHDFTGNPTLDPTG